MSRLARPLITSSPWYPQITSLPLVPLSTSAASVPTIVQSSWSTETSASSATDGQAHPGRGVSVAAIVASATSLKGQPTTGRTAADVVTGVVTTNATACSSATANAVMI